MKKLIAIKPYNDTVLKRMVSLNEVIEVDEARAEQLIKATVAKEVDKADNKLAEQLSAQEEKYKATIAELTAERDQLAEQLKEAKAALAKAEKTLAAANKATAKDKK